MTSDSIDASTAYLERIAYLPEGTLGRLTLPNGWIGYTVERPWRGNSRFVSCIPEGEYELSWHQSSKYGKLYPVGPLLSGVPNRDGILIHPANLPSEVQGCIAPGLSFTFTATTPKVVSSQDAFKIIMLWLGPTNNGHLIGKRIIVESARAMLP